MEKENQEYSNKMKLSQKVREACIKAAREGFNDALISGLCSEGAMEAAISSIQKLDLELIIQER